ncbi:MAG: pantetheine-phosphate adenylyltransferase [Candidatus Diapherotrites archaeon]|uniref:Phosphopantetheine adenylyltransferase n=1 Tax=Candidatus Iainarchaeum sp. TaxID=3101447 RepID=A0A8T3YIL6_9ARCH|nr:pantetheine-phosphate adenylyltransferase [Candidatus Diapherotrites archaeon]
MKAIYPGTFDPLTNGHMDVIRRGVRLFGSLVVAVAENPKKSPFFSAAERADMVRESVRGIAGVEVKVFGSLLVDFMRAEKAAIVLRGLRETSDFPFEFQSAVTNRLLAPEIETVFVMTSAENFYVTSSIVKEIAFLGGDVSGMVPAPVRKRLAGKS